MRGNQRRRANLGSHYHQGGKVSKRLKDYLERLDGHVRCDIFAASCHLTTNPSSGCGVISKTPPFSAKARLEAGYCLRLLQRGNVLTMPVSRPMPSIGVRCHELRIRDESHAWRIIYRPDVDGVLIVDVFNKNQDRTPKNIIDHCKRVLKRYDKARAKSSTQYESA